MGIPNPLCGLLAGNRYTGLWNQNRTSAEAFMSNPTTRPYSGISTTSKRDSLFSYICTWI
jgi:hypothetical protein